MSGVTPFILCLKLCARQAFLNHNFQLVEWLLSPCNNLSHCFWILDLFWTQTPRAALSQSVWNTARKSAGTTFFSVPTLDSLTFNHGFVLSNLSWSRSDFTIYSLITLKLKAKGNVSARYSTVISWSAAYYCHALLAHAIAKQSRVKQCKCGQSIIVIVALSKHPLTILPAWLKCTVVLIEDLITHFTRK